MERNNCDSFALIAYCAQDLLYTDERTYKYEIEKNNKDIKRLRDKLGVLEMTEIELKNFL